MEILLQIIVTVGVISVPVECGFSLKAQVVLGHWKSYYEGHPISSDNGLINQIKVCFNNLPMYLTLLGLKPFCQIFATLPLQWLLGN